MTNNKTVKQNAQKSNFSLDINNALKDKDNLNRLYEIFYDKMEECGNEYLYPIQEDRKARIIIGEENLINAMLILIKSHINYDGYSIYMDASHDMRLIDVCDDWLLESTIAKEIISKFPKTKDIENIINNDKRLSLEIHDVSKNYKLT
jgi:hypothetical protein